MLPNTNRGRGSSATASRPPWRGRNIGVVARPAGGQRLVGVGDVAVAVEHVHGAGERRGPGPCSRRMFSGLLWPAWDSTGAACWPRVEIVLRFARDVHPAPC